MTKTEKLKRWRAAIASRNWTVKRAAKELGVVQQVAYNWNCGSQTIPEDRLIQLEAMK
jgi:hypothetical protein